MNDQANTDRTAARLRDALCSAANVMVVHDVPEPAPSRQPIDRARQRAPRNWGRLAPLAAAAGIVVIAAGTVIGTHLADSTGTHAGTGSGTAASNQTTTGATAPASRPEFYLTVTYPASGQNVLQFQVRRTDGGAVTSTKTIPAANVGWGGYLASAAGDRTFYFSHYVCSTTVAPDTTFDRITITSSGRISGFAPAGPPVKGMVTAFAVSPGGTQVAYNALPGVCAGGGFRSTGASSVSVEDLSTGAVKTWQDEAAQAAVGAAQPAIGRVSWTPDGHTVVLDEAGRGPDRGDLTVFALDPSGGGGSLQAHSATLLKQNANCTTCVTTALAGPEGRLIELESRGTGSQTRVQVVSVPTKAGRPATVLYTGPRGAPANAADNTDLFTDASGSWPLLWPSGSLSAQTQEFSPAGWVGDGQLHPLTGLAQIFPQGIAW
jgi:hypothetical protein